MADITVTVVLKPKVDVQAPPGADGLGKLLRDLVEAAKIDGEEKRIAAMVAAQMALIQAGLPEEEFVIPLSKEIIEAVSPSGKKAKIPHEHRLTIKKLAEEA